MSPAEMWKLYGRDKDNYPVGEAPPIGKILMHEAVRGTGIIENPPITSHLSQPVIPIIILGETCGQTAGKCL